MPLPLPLHACLPACPPPACPPARCAACPAKGFTAHVLGYTVHAVVEAVCQAGEPGCLDDSLLLILPLMVVGGRASGRAGGPVGNRHASTV